MTSQDHASHLLAIWQQRRALPPVLRLADFPPLAPLDDYDAILESVRKVIKDV